MAKNKNFAFKYIVFKLAEWYMSVEKIDSIEIFNEKNDLGIRKMLLMPFFICVANGDRDALLEFFDNFYPEDIGMVEKDLFTKYEKGYSDSDIEIFEASMKINLFNIKSKFISDILDEIINKDIEVNENIAERIPRTLIDRSLEILASFNGNLIKQDLAVLTFYSRRHPSWISYYRLYKDVPNMEGSKLIPGINLKKEFSMYSENPELLIYI